MRSGIKPYPGLAQAWGIFGIYLGAAILIGLAMGGLFSSDGGGEFLSVANFTAYNLSMLFVVWFAWRNFIRTSPKFLHFTPVNPSLYAVLLLLTLSFAVALDPLTNLMPLPEFMKEVFEQLARKDLWTFLMVCISGPLLEEVLFRGIILDGFLRRYSPLRAIFWSAFLFGLFHLNPWQFVPGFIIGMLIGYIYWKTRSLAAAVFIHFVNNTFSYLVMYFYGTDVESFRDLFAEQADYTIFVLAAMLVLLLAVFMAYRLLEKSEIEWTSGSETGFLSSPGQAAGSEER